MQLLCISMADIMLWCY